MRSVTVFLVLFLYFAASPASAMEVLLANATPYEILGLFLEGISDEGPQLSSFSALRALPGERCMENNGNMTTLTALQVDFGRGRIAVKDYALKDRAELTLRMDDAGKPVLSTPDGRTLPLVFHDLRFPEQDDKAVDFMTLVEAKSREDVLKIGGTAVLDFKEFGDVVMPVQFGDNVWTGVVSFDREGDTARIRLMTERSSDAWKEVLPEFLAAFGLRPLSLALPDGVTIRYYDKSDANAAGSADEAREQLVALATDDALLEEKPDGKLAALIGTENAFLECGQSQQPASPSLGAVLNLSASNLVLLDVEPDISARVELERMTNSRR